MDNIIISKQLGANQVAIYAIAYRLYSIFMTPVQAFSGSFLPALNDALAKNDLAWLKTIIKKTG